LTYVPTGEKTSAKGGGDDTSGNSSGARDRIIAMGFPAEGMEGMYRNPLSEVIRFFETFHKDHYKIYNLCSERAYDVTNFFSERAEADKRCERFGFDDHNPCPLAMIRPFCESLHSWLAEHEDNVASVHCKAGKGRTGTMICAYLVHTGRFTAEEALYHFGHARTKNGKGVTIPSQRRYVHYYEQLRRNKFHITTPTYQITHIRMVTVPTFDGVMMGYGCDPYFQVFLANCVREGGSGGSSGVINTTTTTIENGDDPSRGGKTVTIELNNTSNTSDGSGIKNGSFAVEMKKIYDYSQNAPVRHVKRDERFVDLNCSTHNLLVKGDVKIVFFDKDQLSKEKMMHVWFHTAFIENNYLCFEKSVIDKACKDKDNRIFANVFKLEIFLHKVDPDLLSQSQASSSTTITSSSVLMDKKAGGLSSSTLSSGMYTSGKSHPSSSMEGPTSATSSGVSGASHIETSGVPSSGGESSRTSVLNTAATNQM